MYFKPLQQLSLQKSGSPDSDLNQFQTWSENLLKSRWYWFFGKKRKLARDAYEDLIDILKK